MKEHDDIYDRFCGPAFTDLKTDVRTLFGKIDRLSWLIITSLVGMIISLTIYIITIQKESSNPIQKVIAFNERDTK